MKLGYIGLGKMGANMVARLAEKGHECETYDTSGSGSTQSLSELVAAVSAPRLIWVMVPASATDGVIDQLAHLLSSGDTVIDGGNSFYKKSVEHAGRLARKGIEFLDAGISGGPSGARNGACVMIGGKKELFLRYEQLFRDISAPAAYAYLGPAGAGHFVKMVHNGIEYGMMQAIAEGFEVLHQSPMKLDLNEITRIYNSGSVIESRLIGWLLEGYEKYGTELADISSTVAHTGEGAWTVEAAKELGVETPIIEGSLLFRKQSGDNPSYAGRVLSLLRALFGGHSAK
ncbi:MAG: decarboxylating 6-phosphogluconate dehydrogenase [Patescibacteria group bacterium]